jgi:hypothetical protein
MVLQNTPGAAIELAGLEIRQERMESRTAKDELLLSVEEGEGGVEVSLEYSSDLYEGRRLSGCWGITRGCWRRVWPTRSRASGRWRC